MKNQMFGELQFVLKKILAIEKKYALYFRDRDFNLRNCVNVVWEEPISIHLTKDHQLPYVIACEVEEMFWVETDKLEELGWILAEIKKQKSEYDLQKARFYNICASLASIKTKRGALLQRIHSA
jgi:hypothetical protein